jgi:acyl carrier protein
MPDTSTDAIRRWLIERAAYYLERPADEVDPDALFVQLGLDSVYSLTLCGDVEDRFDCVLAPTITWDHPTINALAGYLGTELAGSR